MSARVLLSVVTPAFNEAANLPVLHHRLTSALAGLEWEWIVVDDHSSDETFPVISALHRDDPRVRGFRLARNSGSHTAIACGLDRVIGEATAVLAADLQDPPELLPELLAAWREGAQVVWAARDDAPWLSRVYYSALRRMAGLAGTPKEGADFFLMDNAVVVAFRRFREQRTSILALIAWMGFRQSQVRYRKQERIHGSSGWTLGKKVALFADSVTAFTSAPIRWMTFVGLFTTLLGVLYAGFVIVRSMGDRPIEGGAPLMIAVLMIGGIQMVMMGVLGEYVWRALDEARARPRYLVEESTECDPRESRSERI